MNKYLIDSNVLIACAFNTPFEYFPSFWIKLEEYINNNQVIICDAVVTEISAKADELKKWISNYKSLYRKTFEPDIVVEAKLIINKYPNLVDINNPNDQADPYLIALAKIDNLCLISDEKYSENATKARIPYVCKNETVDCLTRFDFFKKESWKF